MTFDAAQSFNFLPVPTDIHFGSGAVRSLPDRVAALGARRVLLVTDPGVRAAGLVGRAAGPLEEAGVSVTIFDRVTADSGTSQICESVDALRSAGAELVVGLGGGSALDTAKAAAALATNPGSPLDYVGLHKLAVRPTSGHLAAG